VPLLEPREKLDEAGEQGDEAGVVAAAEAFPDFDVVGADRSSELKAVVAVEVWPLTPTFSAKGPRATA